MGRNTRHTPYGEENVEGFDEEASVSKFMSYRSTPSNSNGSFPPEESVPLFLSDYDDEEPQPPSFGRIRDRGTVSPRIIFRASLLAAAAAGILLVVLSVENPMALFANAKASLVGTSAGQFGAAQIKPAPETVLASAEPTAPAVQPGGVARALPQTAKNGPSRDEIATAFRTARQVPPEMVAPQAVATATTAPVAVAAAPAVAPVVAAAPAVRRLDPEELAALLKRAKSLIAVGDIAPARLLLERAADAQEASAALLLAQTYDPGVLGTQDMRSITPDPTKAREWYQKAARYGSRDAQQRLSQMQN
jgi:TPR repeat protein